MDRAVVVPVEGRGQAARRRPAQHLVKLLLLRLGRLLVVVHAPGDVLADAVEAQPVVAEAHRQHRGQRLEIRELVVAARRAQAVDDADRQRAVAPHLEQRAVGLDRHVVAAGIEHAGDAEAVERAEERARAGDLLLHARARQPVEQVADGAVVGRDPAGRLAVGAGFDGQARRERGVVRNAERRRSRRRSAAPRCRAAAHRRDDPAPRPRSRPASGGASRRTAFRSSRRRRSASFLSARPARRRAIASSASASDAAPIQCTSVV